MNGDQANAERFCVSCVLLFLAFSIGGVFGQYSMRVHLSSVTSTEGGQLEVNCEVTNKRENTFFIVWVKKAHGDEVEIGTNDHVNELFNKTGRYKGRYALQTPGNYSKVNFYLTISNLSSVDSGEIGCRIHGNVEILRKFTVIAPVTSVRLMSRDMDNTHAIAYEDKQTVTFVEGERRKFFCFVNGSYPQPDVKVTVGRRDVTHLFDVSAELVKDGRDKGLHSFYYKVELINHGLEMQYEFSHETMTCTARDPDHVLPAKMASINVQLSGYSPKFRCPQQSIASAYQSNVQIVCPVVAEPPVYAGKVRWRRLQNGYNMTLEGGDREGHYKVEMRGGKSYFEKVLELTIDTAYPQTFRTYLFEATNSFGTTVHEIDLSQPGPPQPLRSSSGRVVLSLLALASASLIFTV